MKRSLLAALLTGLVPCLLSACGGGGGSSILFSDNFDDPAEAGSSPWAGGATLPNGWVSAYPSEQRWWVATSGGTGDTHALVANNVGDTLLHAISGQNYTVSVNIKYRPSDLYVYPTYGDPQQAWIVGRAELTSFFGCRLEYEPMGNKTWLLGVKWTESSGNTPFEEEFFTGAIELGVYYHLSLTLDGDTVTCRASSPTHAEVSASIEDDGSIGTKLTGTNAGIDFNGAVSFHPYFDDFLVEKL